MCCFGVARGTIWRPKSCSLAPSRATREDKRRQGLGKADTQSNTCGKTMGGKGRQDFGKVDTIQQRHIRGETMGDQRGDKGRQGLGKADTPSNTGPHTHMGRQWETSGDTVVGRRIHTIRRETGGDKGRQTLRRQTHHPTKAHMWGDNGRQDRTHYPTQARMWGDKGTRPREGGHTIQHRHACGEDPWEGGHAIHQRETRRGTLGDKGKQGETRPSGKRTHHPTPRRTP